MYPDPPVVQQFVLAYDWVVVAHVVWQQLE
jgi:hypothetical protein